MTVTLLRGDALSLPLADASVDLVVTSPPYFGLRSYQDGGQHYAGQIGSEATPAEWVDAMLAATREMVRVLKSCGSIWVNLGDSYYSGKGAPGRTTVDAKSPARTVRREGGNALDGPTFGIRQKSLIGLPWRYALACIDQLGLILRAEVIWSKPNGLPESVTDRVRRSHEQWFHFTVQPRYFSAVDEIREPHIYPNDDRSKRPSGYEAAMTGHMNGAPNPLGKLPGSVWSIPSQPLTVPPELGVDHFAAFPMEWPRRLIAGWSPSGVCTACGEGRRPVCDRKPMVWRPGPHAAEYNAPGATRLATSGTMLAAAETRITGYICDCWPPGDASHLLTPTTPSVVLDPFGGTGTTALVAHVMGRHGISIDMSADYTRLAAWRTTDPGELAKAAQVEKPAVQTTGQTSLFEHLEGA